MEQKHFTPEELMDNFGRLSGKFGSIVFYHRNGINYYRAAPGPYSKPPSDAQLSYRERFKLAVTAAKAAIQNPALKAALTQRAKGLRTAYSQAIKEFLENNPSEFSM